MSFTGGVFVTWRQRDPKEPELGLYGKKNRKHKIDAKLNEKNINRKKRPNTIFERISKRSKFKIFKWNGKKTYKKRLTNTK